MRISGMDSSMKFLKRCIIVFFISEFKVDKSLCSYIGAGKDGKSKEKINPPADKRRLSGYEYDALFFLFLYKIPDKQYHKHKNGDHKIKGSEAQLKGIEGTEGGGPCFRKYPSDYVKGGPYIGRPEEDHGKSEQKEGGGPAVYRI